MKPTFSDGFLYVYMFPPQEIGIGHVGPTGTNTSNSGLAGQEPAR